jgi:hypothetical protein
MPLFFIAIAAGAMTLGAATVDVTNDVSQQKREAAAHYDSTRMQALSYSDCVKSAEAQGLSQAACPR